MFSKSCEYGLQAMLYIALHSKNNTNIGLKEIAEAQEIPSHFLSKILQLLVKNKFIYSIKGPNGGFCLAKSPDRITMIEIVKVIDGLDMFDKCGIGLKKCSDKTPCPIHYEYKEVKLKIRAFLTSQSLSQLCDDIELGNSIVNFKKV